MPKVVLLYGPSGHLEVLTPEQAAMLPPDYDGPEIEMNNSLYRQIKASSGKYWQWQERLANWYDEALNGSLKRISQK